jgi:hypothetical protein
MTAVAEIRDYRPGLLGCWGCSDAILAPLCADHRPGSTVVLVAAERAIAMGSGELGRLPT